MKFLGILAFLFPIVISALSAGEDGENEKFSDPKYYAKIFREIAESRDTSPSAPYPQLRRFKALAVSAVFVCHMTETLYVYKAEAYKVFPRESAEREMSVAHDNTRLCAAEAEKAARPLFSKSQTELAKKAAASAKLKSYFSAWLSVVRAMPRVGLNQNSVARVQGEDDQLLTAKAADLDVELF